MNVTINGSGSYLPGRPVTNEELVAERKLDTTAEWIESHTGIRSRHHAGPEETTATLAAEAAKRALAAAELDPVRLGRILVCTTTPNWLSPATACEVQKLIGAECPAVDMQSACAGFFFGLDYAWRLVETSEEAVLVIGAETKSRFVRANDRRLAPVFADGAGAFVIAPGKSGGIQDIILWSDGRFAGNIITPAGGSAMPATEETVRGGLHATQMTVEGQTIAEHAVEQMVRLTRLLLERNHLSIDDVRYFVPHQANFAILKQWMANVGASRDRVVSTIAFAGNTVTASVPHAFDFFMHQGKAKPGDRILLLAVGGGYSGGAMLYEIPGAER